MTATLTTIVSSGLTTAASLMSDVAPVVVLVLGMAVFASVAFLIRDLARR